MLELNALYKGRGEESKEERCSPGVMRGGWTWMRVALCKSTTVEKREVGELMVYRGIYGCARRYVRGYTI